MNANFRHVLSIVARYRLFVAIAGAVLIAMLMTFISIAMYIRSGVASLDLSRPGYEQAREQIRATNRSKNFNATGPVTQESLNEFLILYRAESGPLLRSEGFSESALSDEQLRLVPQPSQ